MLSHAQLPDAGQVPHAHLDLRPPALWHRIAQVELTTAAATISLTNLPTTFTQWRLQLYAIGTEAAAYQRDTITMRLNGDTGAHYDSITVTHEVPIDQLVTISRAGTSVPVATCEASNTRANTISPVTIDFFRPSHTSWEKVGKHESAAWGDRTADADFRVKHGWWTWRNLAAITTITLTMTIGEFDTGSVAYLWGLVL